MFGDLLSFIESLGGDLSSLFSGAGSDIWSLAKGFGNDALSLFGGQNANPLEMILQMLGTVGNAYNNQLAGNFANRLASEESRALGIAMDPAKLSTQINQMMRYMTPTQRRAVLGPAESAAAARGQATSPGQMQIIDEQAMAPYYDQEYRNAEQAVLAGLQLPFSHEPHWPQMRMPAFASGGLPTDPNALADMLLAAGIDPTEAASLLTNGVF